MATARPVRETFDPKTFNFWERLKEIDMFFQETHPVYQTLERLAGQLRQAGIPYAVMGAMAVNLQGARRTTDDLDVLMTKAGLEQFRKDYVGKEYDPVPGRSRRFVDRQNGINIDILVTGHFPGRGGPGPFPFPDPTEASEEKKNVRVLTLPQLIQLKLAARRYYDFGDVVFLIRVHNLDESFLEKLHSSVHQDYIECLEEMRREKEYEEREG
jgi:hypothetical protein